MADRAVLARSALHGTRFLPRPSWVVIVTLVLVEGGATLDAPADPSSSDYPRAPNGISSPSSKCSRCFPAGSEVIGTIVIPTCPGSSCCVVAILGSGLAGKLAHFLACGFVFAVVGCAGYSDGPGAVLRRPRCLVSGVAKKGRRRTPARDLPGRPARRGHPARWLRRISCAGTRSRRGGTCWNGAAWAATFFEGKGSGEQTASDLARFGSRAWVRGLLEKPTSPTYFGKAAKFDGMAEWKKSSKLERQGTRRRGRLRRVVRRHSRRL